MARSRFMIMSCHSLARSLARSPAARPRGSIWGQRSTCAHVAVSSRLPAALHLGRVGVRAVRPRPRPSPHVCLCLFYYDDGTESNKFGYIAVVTPLRRPTANCFTVPASHKYFITVYPLPLPFPLSPAGRSLPLNQADSSFHTLPARAEKGGRERKVGWLVGVPLFLRLAATPSLPLSP